MSKIKNAKHMTRTIIEEHRSVSVQKIPPKTTKYSKNETILKSGQFAKSIAHAKAIIAFEKWV